MVKGFLKDWKREERMGSVNEDSNEPILWGGKQGGQKDEKEEGRMDLGGKKSRVSEAEEKEGTRYNKGNEWK